MKLNKPFKLYLILIFFSITLISTAQWTQVGQNIYGENYQEANGKCVSMNANGDIVALSNNYGVRVYQFTSGNWEQMGNTIAMDNVSALSLSDDGTTLAFAYGGNDDAGPNYGLAKVYHYSSGAWTQVGSNLYGDSEDACLGQALNLSYNGNILAISSTFPYDFSTDYGRVIIYQNISNNWVQIGNTIIGDEIGDNFGYSLSLDSIGKTLVVGAIYSNQSASYSGEVKVFKNNSDNWEQVGIDILGEAANNKFGFSVSINNDGSVIALAEKYNNNGATNEAGQVRIYRNISDNWMQIGDNIVGDNTEDLFGNSVSLNADGSVVVIGAPVYELKGQIKVFKNISDNWTQVRQDLYGEYDGNYNGESFGHAVCISDDGSTIIASHPYNDEAGNNHGKVSIYQYSCDDINNFNLIDEDTICPNENVLLDAGMNFDSYLWSTGELTQIITVADSGYYKVTVSGFECGEATDSIHLFRGVTPVIQLLADTSICQNSSILIDADGSYEMYEWNTGASSSSITISDSGYYSVTVTQNSCSNSDSVHIGINPLPDLELSDTLICPYDTITLEAGNWNTYLWNNGSEESSILANTEGEYSVTVTSNFNCLNSDNLFLSHSLNPTGLEDTIEICLNGEIPISANPINNNTWNSIQNTDTINYLFVNDTTFFLEAIDTMMCVINDTVFLKVDSNFVVPTWLDDTVLTCYNNELTLFCNPENENIWNSILLSNSITYLAANDTTFYLQVTSPIGCQNTDTIFIDQDSTLNFIFDNTYISSDTIMLGDTLWLYGTEAINSNFSTFTKNPGIFLPDGGGIYFTDTVDVTSNGTINSLNEIQNIHFNMEHSYAGDLSIDIVCPNGQTMEILGYPNGLGSHFLGEPIDYDMSNTLGEGYNYNFSPQANLTFLDVENQYYYTFTDNDETEYIDHKYIPAGEYSPTGNFSNLIGCPVNGKWKISIEDHMSSDNGVIFSWSISLYGRSITTWLGENVNEPHNDTTFAVPATIGWHDYTYFLENEYGCMYDTTASVYVDYNVNVREVINNNIKLYPNPASQNIVIQNNNFIGKEYELKIYNPIGKLIYTKMGETSKINIDISSWSNGIYFVSVGTKRVKFIKE